MKARRIAALVLIACLPFGMPIAAAVWLVRRWRRA
jgi:hypothetical protein